MKNVFFLLLASLCLGAIIASNVSAANADTKIATMDLKKVLALSTVGQAAQAKVKEKYDEYQGKLAKKEQDLMTLQAEIEKKRTVWSEEVLSQNERDLKRGIQDFQTDTKYAENDMMEFQKKQIGPILKELEGIIDEYGKANGIAVILDASQGLLYQDESLDISDAIAVELDKKHPADSASK